MSVRVMADVWDFGPEDPIDCSVLVALGNHSNDDGKSCYPSVERVAKMIRRSQRTVERSITALEISEWITVERGGGRGIVSNYEINVEKLKERQSVAYLESKSKSKERQPRQEKATATTIKGDSHDKPPHPLIGVTINEPRTEPSITRMMKKTGFTDDQIETIYQAYPRKVAHAPALKAIRKALEGIEKSSKSSPEEVFEWLLGTVRAYASSAAGQKQTGTDYRPHPATWFNAERYFDDPQELNKTGGNANGRVESNKEALRIALERIASQTEGSDCDEVDGDDQLQSGNSQPGLFGDHVNSTIEGKR
jgi:DNA-binding transcriptional regulator YhcF (GntR family)